MANFGTITLAAPAEGGAPSAGRSDAAALAESAAPPHPILPDGRALGVDGLLALLEGGPEKPPPIETAAGAETGAGEAGEAGEAVSSGGGSAYGDDLGGPSVAGLAALGTLDAATESGVSNFPPAEDRAEPAPASAAVTASDGQAGAEAGFNLTVDATVVDTDDPGLLGSANIIGSAGNDVGGDALRGSNGVDDIIYGLGGDDKLSGKGGDDTLAGGDGDDDLRGEKGADSLYGGTGDDTLDGGHDGDILYGGSGADVLDGDKGDDSLDGGSGADTLIGGTGDDQLRDGADADVFLFDFGGGQEAPGGDVVLDFDAGEGDALRFVNLLDIGGDGPDLGDFSAAVSSVQDDGSDVTLVFEDGGTLLLGGLGTGAIVSVNALLSEIGSSSVEVV